MLLDYLGSSSITTTDDSYSTSQNMLRVHDLFWHWKYSLLQYLSSSTTFKSVCPQEHDKLLFIRWCQEKERESLFQLRRPSRRDKQYTALNTDDNQKTFWVSKAATIINVFLIQKHVWQPKIRLHSLRQETELGLRGTVQQKVSWGYIFPYFMRARGWASHRLRYNRKWWSLQRVIDQPYVVDDWISAMFFSCVYVDRDLVKKTVNKLPSCLWPNKLSQWDL